MYRTTMKRTANLLQLTDSWDTGPQPSGSSSHSTSAFEQFPVRKKTESAFAYQMRVQKYYARVGRSFSEAPVFSGRATTDEGHSFHRVKYGMVPGRMDLLIPTTGAVSQSLPYTCGAFLPDVDGLWLVNYLKAASAPLGLDLIGVGNATQANALLTVQRNQVTGAYSSMLPEKQLFGWGETVVELARGNFPRAIPDLIRRASFGKKLSVDREALKEATRSMGSDYLNARFGIEPILRDTVETVEHLLAVHDLLYDNVKRSRVTSAIHAEVPTSFAMAFNGVTTVTSGSPPMCTNRLHSEARVVARFRKAKPNGSANAFYERAQSWLIEVGAGPRLTWDLLPWSWLVDWSGNIGNMIENAAFASSGRYLTDYAWVTRKTSSSTEMPAWVSRDRLGRVTTRASKAYKHAFAIQRSIVSPFGPEFTMPQLSAYQWSILVSLGLARVR